jgi:hypothetical protein
MCYFGRLTTNRQESDMIGLAMILAAAGLASDQPIYLVCLGAGSANRATTTYGSAYDNGGNSAWGQSVSRREVPFDDQVNIELSGDGGGRVRMPRAMLPPIRGGDNGWFKISDVRRTDNEITGTIGVNFMNKPKLRLDRMRGSVSISGKAGDYSGTCQPYDPATSERKF